MADWVTISALATAGGTLVLAVATFSSVRSANRAARVAERSLSAGLRPVLITSREDDSDDHVRFGDGYGIVIPGHRGVLEFGNGNIYMGLGLRNAGAGLAVIHGWYAMAYELEMRDQQTDVASFHTQVLDLYIPAGGDGYWVGALRDDSDPVHAGLCQAVHEGHRVAIDLMYGDLDGGQRTIARFALVPADDGNKHFANVLRYWNLDGADPRSRDG